MASQGVFVHYRKGSEPPFMVLHLVRCILGAGLLLSTVLKNVYAFEANTDPDVSAPPKVFHMLE